MSNFKAHVSKDYLIFCAAHFITYGGISEPLHGYNYRVSVTVDGDLQTDEYVFNFVILKRLMRTLVDQLDHRTLLPESDLLILPPSNMTAEKLAEDRAGQLRAKIGNIDNLTACEMEVSEVKGQSAIYREEWR